MSDNPEDVEEFQVADGDVEELHIADGDEVPPSEEEIDQEPNLEDVEE